MHVQVVRGIPASALAGALLQGGPARERDNGLLLQLEALRAWANTVAGSDQDPQCRMLAEVCLR